MSTLPEYGCFACLFVVLSLSCLSVSSLFLSCFCLAMHSVFLFIVAACVCCLCLVHVSRHLPSPCLASVLITSLACLFCFVSFSVFLLYLSVCMYICRSVCLFVLSIASILLLCPFNIVNVCRHSELQQKNGMTLLLLSSSH